MKKTLLAIALGLGSIQAFAQATPSMEEMWQIIQQQQAEIKALKGKLDKTENKVEEIDLKVVATADAVENNTGTAVKNAGWAAKTTVGGYAEHHYNNFEDSNNQVDAHRFVLFLGHQFSDSVRMFSELEVEHGFAGPDDEAPGEVELEQAYIEWDFAQNHSLVAGQFLIPVGILNETHEPDAFYGVERNSVEKNILPATWWETGLMAKGEIAPGLSYKAGIHGGLNINVGAGNFEIRDGRQKSAKATAEDLAYTAQFKYTAIQGLELAATLQYQEDVTQGFDAETYSALLTELHAIYTSGNAQVRALWAEWDIDGDAFAATGADKQDGWYIEPSYKLNDQLGFFARYSTWNNEAGISNSDDHKVWAYGVNYWLTPGVVFKADYTDNVDVDGPDNDSFNLGLGWSF